MFARVMHIKSTPQRIRDITSLFDEAVVPALKQQEGYVDTLLLADPSTGRGMSITLWVSEAAQQASEANGFLREQVAKVMPLLVEPPVREAYAASRPC